MEMQPEAESYTGQVSCGGAVRRVDTGILGELRRRVKPEVEEARERAASASLAADAMPVAGFAPAEAESGSDLDARRKTLRRRVVIVLVVAAIGIAAACWEYLPSMLAWLADPQAVRAFVADNAVMSRLTMLGINATQILLGVPARRARRVGEWLRFWLLGGYGVVPRGLGGCNFGNLLDDAPVGLALGGVVFRSKPVRPVFLAQQCQAP